MGKINLTNISKSYGSVLAVDRLSLEIREGEFVTLLGPSGCGKTTTLRMIAGLEDPSDGELSFEEQVLYSREKGIYVSPEERNLGFMFQSYALWPHMNVYKNISLGLEARKVPASEIRTRVMRVLDQVQMAGYEDRYPSELSGGQQQRVALARMIAAQSGIFLMDEPLSNLDALLRIDMRSELKHLHKELGSTSVYVTHDQVEALTLSDRIVVMNSGRIMQSDTPERIYKKPQNLFVSRFVGSPPINIIKGVVRSTGGAREFVFEDMHIGLGPELSAVTDLPTDKEVCLAVRAEDIEIVPASRSDEALPFSVYAILPSGSETIVTAKRGDVEVAVTVSGFYAVTMNEVIHLKIDPARVSFYDCDTEELIH